MGEFYFLCVKNLSLERADSLECRASGHPVVCVSGPYQGGGQPPPEDSSRIGRALLGTRAGSFVQEKCGSGFRPFGHSPLAYLYRIPSQSTSSYCCGQIERPTNDLPHPRPAWVSGGPLLTPCGAFGFNVGRLGDLPRGPKTPPMMRFS